MKPLPPMDRLTVSEKGKRVIQDLAAAQALAAIQHAVEKGVAEYALFMKGPTHYFVAVEIPRPLLIKVKVGRRRKSRGKMVDRKSLATLESEHEA
jgi:hypothetical protein